MTERPLPDGLDTGGAVLWESVVSVHTLDEVQAVQLLEACRAKDRLDKLDLLLRGDVETWAKLVHKLRTEDYELHIDDALAKANSTANQMKQLLASLRLPDDVGKRPQQRGSARGSYGSSAAKSGKVSSLDRARAAKSGA